MQIKQWKEKALSQYSYAVLSDCDKSMVLIDPVRNPQQYLDYAKEKDVSIIGIIETHPHADFVSGHAELARITGATIYTSELVKADYDHVGWKHGSTLSFGKIRLQALLTPGHSPDSLSILLEHEEKPHAVFSGDALFIGDCGRPDLREGAGNIKTTRSELGRLMYHTLRDVFIPLADEIVLYPGHGAGTLCGKSLGDADSSTMGNEKATNWSLQQMTEEVFVQELLKDQPFVPAYFPYDVEVNRKGAADFGTGTRLHLQSADNVLPGKNITFIIDGRDKKSFSAGYLPGSINLMEDGKFETWLGSIISPQEPFYLAGESAEQIQRLMDRTALIGYEVQVKAAINITGKLEKEAILNMEDFRSQPERYNIVDLRNTSETAKEKIFTGSLSIPLHELRKRFHEISLEKPIVVHCAGGYRSAAGSSLLRILIGSEQTVYDLGDAVRQFRH